MVFTDGRSRTPSAGYSLSAIASIVGLFFLFVSLYGSWLQGVGRSPIDAMGWPGDVAFAGMFALVFALRLIFSSRSPPVLQAAIRAGFTALFGLGVVLSIVALPVAVSAIRRGGPHAEPVFIGCFTVFAAVCQIGAVLWLLRYRRE